MSDYVGMKDVLAGFYKSVCFGGLIAWVCCYKGYTTGFGAIIVHSIHALIASTHQRLDFSGILVSHEIPEVSNVATPVRLVNCALQTEFEGAWVEIGRFAINTAVGVAGFCDPAKNRWHMEKRNEDLGQTLGRYGIGTSIYFDWPILGPSNVRDTVGYAGDLFLDPFTYLIPRFEYNVGVKAYETVNGTSLRADDYEDFKKAAIDPYVALRDAYYQYRRNQVRNGEGQSARPRGTLPTD